MSSSVSKRDTAKKQLSAINKWIREANEEKTQLLAAEQASDKLEAQYKDFLRYHKDVLSVTGSSELEFQKIEGESGKSYYDSARLNMDELISKIKLFAESNKGSSEVIGSSNQNGKQSTSSDPKPSNNNNNNLELNDRIAENAGNTIRRMAAKGINATCTNTSSALAAVLLETLTGHWNSYSLAAFSDWNRDIDESFEDVQSEYMLAKANLMEIISLHSQTNTHTLSTNNGTGSSIARAEFQLPRIEIPKFSGKFQDWLSFYDLFSSLVDNVPNLSNVQKMYYLRSSVEGEAEQLIRSYNCTEANYTAAWNSLKERYNNRRLIVNAHMDRLFNIPKMDIESASTTRKHLDTFTESVRALSALNIPTDQWDVFLVHFLQSRLDIATKRAWDMSLQNDELATFAQLRTFLERRCRSMEAEQNSTPQSKHRPASKPTSHPPPHLSSKPNAFHVNSSSTFTSCANCSGQHNISSCPEFRRMYVGLRFKKAKELNLCYNCLRIDHITPNCNSSLSCRTCGCRHHSLLCYKNQSTPSTSATANISINSEKNVLLATALVNTKDSLGNDHKIRILMDTGATRSFITDRCVKMLGLKSTKTNTHISGIAAVNIGFTQGGVEIIIDSKNPKTIFYIQALVLPKITNALPMTPIDRSKISFLEKIPQLADPKFDTPDNIDMLIGSDYLGEMLLDGKIHDPIDRSLYTQNTVYGWVIIGPISNTQAPSLNAMMAITNNNELDKSLQRFWELEAIGPTETRTPEELNCEAHFAATHKREPSGRYIVELPFKENAPRLGNSKAAALKSFEQLERRLSKNPNLRLEYTKFLNEYIELGHMQRITHEVDENKSFYLPHHPVFKMSSTSTKIRVVFDASRKTSSGASLNNALMVGPQLQNNLADILLRFRKNAIAFCSDIVKMYRQIRTTPESSEYQRILWRPSPKEDICTYRLDTVTYGTASASYLATKALQQLAIDEAYRFPLASNKTQSDFYMDDLMTGSDNISEALELQRQLIGLTQSGGFKLSKWASNNNLILESVAANEREIDCPLELHLEESIKTLGLAWNPSVDCFQYRVTLSESDTTPTKRIILSEVASLFDPLGLLAPVVVAAKIFLQSLWAEGIAWDQPLPPRLATRWQQYRSALPALHALRIPRWLGFHGTNTHQLHGFCDASELAYAAVIYLRSSDPSNKISVRLITARTKVAPIKKISLPRLELCGATLLAELMVHVKNAMKLPDVECRAWCDSTVTLAWIRKPSHCWQTFVANRVSKIQAATPTEIWQHVSGAQNPADASSRGLTPSQLVAASLWWQGPQWLQTAEEDWPRNRNDFNTNIDMKPITAILHATIDTLDLLNRYSSLSQLQRSTALILRFAFNCKQSKPSRRTGPITTTELTEASSRLVKIYQQTTFGMEIAACTAGTPVASKSPLKSLSPFLDHQGLLRVGGRISNAHISFDTKHPILIPKKCHLAELLIAHTHITNMHSGPQLTAASLRQKYWIVSAKNSIKQYIHCCAVCIRHAKQPGRQLMAPLPEHRTNPTRAFLTSGVDYAGPIVIKLQPGRGTKTSKAYIALFICFSTKAIHLELVSSLTSEAFLAAFRRFVARRGKCANLFSDCGTNFIGASKELRNLHNTLINQLKNTSLADKLAMDGTQWHFNPPGAPNFGGIWEAGVKSVKHHLRRTIGETLLTFEELATVLAQIEAILNSRPISPMSDDVNDPQALTPGHFIIGEPMNSVPDPCLPEKITPGRRWQLIQQFTQHFWQRWRREYIVTLQHRYKWTQRHENINIGALALIIDENAPPTQWSLGRVVEIHPGKDGLVRVATLKTRSGLIKRPISKLVIFPNYFDSAK